MVGHACPRNDRISHGEAHPLQAGRWAPAGDKSAAAVLFCFCLTAAHSLEEKKKREKKGGESQIRHLKGGSFGEGNVSFKVGKARNQET